MSLLSHPPTTETASVLYGAMAFLARHEDITNRTTVPPLLALLLSAHAPLQILFPSFACED
jgi:hypothetical protein